MYLIQFNLYEWLKAKFSFVFFFWSIMIAVMSTRTFPNYKHTNLFQENEIGETNLLFFSLSFDYFVFFLQPLFCHFAYQFAAITTEKKEKSPTTLESANRSLCVFLIQNCIFFLFCMPRSWLEHHLLGLLFKSIHVFWQILLDRCTINKFQFSIKL